MMRRERGKQLEVICMDLGEIIPENHLLKQIDKHISFDFIYDKVAHLYSDKGRASIDPVILIKMLIVGYLYGIKSERRLEEEISLNIAYRWFCGLGIADKVPDHSTFSQNRRRRFNGSGAFKSIFNEIVIRCIEQGLVTGEDVVSDGTFIPANASEKSKIFVTEVIEKSTVSYLDELDEDLSQMKGYKNPEPIIVEKSNIRSSTDAECGHISYSNKKGLGYISEMSVDINCGIITGVDVFTANTPENTIILNHIKNQMLNTGLNINNLALDGGYDIGAVHRGLELLNITGYVSAKNYYNNPAKRGFVYNPEKDCFICKCGKEILFDKILYKKLRQTYLRIYSRKRELCARCPHLKECAYKQGSIRIETSPYYPASHANIKRTETYEYQRLRRLRRIWSEGTFAVLKREHKLKRACKRGLDQMNEECLLAAIALNLKRMVKAIDRTKSYLYNSILNIIRSSFLERKFIQMAS